MVPTVQLQCTVRVIRVVCTMEDVPPDPVACTVMLYEPDGVGFA